jgi:hypothetical protein
MIPRNIIRFFSIAAAVACAAGCAPEGPFADDIPNSLDHNIVFVPEKLDNLIGADEAVVSNLFSPGPNARRTFLKPRSKQFSGQSFRFDREYMFRSLKHRRISEAGVSGYDAQEYMWIAVFCLEGTVQAYFIRHQVMGSDDEWMQGRYDSGEFQTSGDLWPGSYADSLAYRAQFSDQ